MAEEIVLRDFTRKEAREAVDRAKEGLGEDRDRFLELFERNAHKVLGYGDFSQMMIDEFGAIVKPQTIRTWIMWARVEREVLLIMINKASTGLSTILSTKKRLTLHEALQLARLPEGTRKAAYDECVDLCEHGKVYRPQAFTTNLTHIVNRRLKALAPPPEPSEPAATTAPTESTASAVETEPEEEAPEEPEYEPGSDDLFEETTPDEPEETAPVSDQTPPSAPRNGEEPDWSEWTHGLVVIHGWVQKRAVDDNGYTRIKAHSLLRDIECWITRSE